MADDEQANGIESPEPINFSSISSDTLQTKSVRFDEENHVHSYSPEEDESSKDPLSETNDDELVIEAEKSGEDSDKVLTDDSYDNNYEFSDQESENGGRPETAMAFSNENELDEKDSESVATSSNNNSIIIEERQSTANSGSKPLQKNKKEKPGYKSTTAINQKEPRIQDPKYATMEEWLKAKNKQIRAERKLARRKRQEELQQRTYHSPEEIRKAFARWCRVKDQETLHRRKIQDAFNHPFLRQKSNKPALTIRRDSSPAKSKTTSAKTKGPKRPVSARPTYTPTLEELIRTMPSQNIPQLYGIPQSSKQISSRHLKTVSPQISKYRLINYFEK